MLDKIIESRRSIKKYSKTKKVDWRDVIECVDAMRFAPMAGNNFSLKFIIVDEKEKIKKIAEYSEQQFISDAKYIVLVCTVPERTKLSYGDRAEKYLRQQAGAAIQNFLLKITEKRLATCWIGHFYDEKIKKLLGIPDKAEIEAIFPIAYPLEKPKPKRKIDLDNVLYFDKYGNKKMDKNPSMDV